MSEIRDSFEIFHWNPNFDTGIAIIDEQHKNLVDLLNKLAGCLVQENDVEFTQIFAELAAYASLHFETEEAIWVSYFNNDSWLKSHQDSHTSFLPTVFELKVSQADKPTKESLREILKFVIRWLIYHIIESDKRMAIVVQNMEIGVSFEDAKKISSEKMLDSNKVLIETILLMYDELSSRSMRMMQERIKRQKISDKLGQANRDLKKLAITDQLTGLYNRRHLKNAFQKELRRARREKHYITFIMLDIDYFKNLNDYYGHIQGDNALKIVSQKLTELCRRPGDFVFRLGGEEFGVLITDQSLKQKNDFSESIRGAIEGLRIPNLGSKISDYLTVSIGVVSKIPGSPDKMESYMKLADTRLYAAKANGRNQVVAKS